MTDKQKYRLVTRSDFDGLACGVLLMYLDMIDELAFVHPKDMQDGKVEVTGRDITTNLPYVPGIYLCFGHHQSEIARNRELPENMIIDPEAPSAARVVYEYFGGKERFPIAWDGMMVAVDKADSAKFEREEILNPTGWVLLNFITDPRTGLSHFCKFRLTNYQLMTDLMYHCSNHSINDILALSDVKERIDVYFEHAEKFKEQLLRCARVEGNLVVLDLRNEEIIFPGNRFMIYVLFPQCNISIQVLWGLNREITVLATGKSIIDRSSKTNVGELMLKYGGGGHQGAGTCQIDNAQADRVLAELIQVINQDG